MSDDSVDFSLKLETPGHDQTNRIVMNILRLIETEEFCW